MTTTHSTIPSANMSSSASVASVEAGVPSQAARTWAHYTAKLTEKRQLTTKFYWLHFELLTPARINFQAGQYLILTVPNDPQKKSYSMVSVPAVDHAVELLVDVGPQGPGSRYVEAMQVGETVQFMAPFGQFVLADRTTPTGQAEQQLAFIATGSGIAPLRAMIEDLLIYQQDTRPMTLYWGLRYAEDQFWYDDFVQLAQQHPHFSFHPVLSRPPESWPLCQGRVTDCLLVHPQHDWTQTGFYLCGNTPMIDSVTPLLQEKGVPTAHIHHERFI